MEGPMAESVTGTQLHFESDASKVEVGYWYGLVLLKMSWLDLFRVEDELKINSQTYCQFLKDTFFNQWYKKESAYFIKTIGLMQEHFHIFILNFSHFFCKKVLYKHATSDSTNTLNFGKSV